MPEKNLNKSPLVRRMTARMVHLLTQDPPSFITDCEFRPIQSMEEFQSCCHLVYLQYRDKNYSKPNMGQVQFKIHQIVRNAATLIALYKKKYILGTFSFIPDSPLGLPMDDTFHQELEHLRANGKKFLETTMLSFNNELLNILNIPKLHRNLIFLKLIKTGFEEVRKYPEYNSVVISFHPRHELFYQGLQFEQFGSLKTYRGAEGNPALAYVLDMTALGEDKDSRRLRELLSMPRVAPKSEGPHHQLNIEDFGRLYFGSKQAAA